MDIKERVEYELLHGILDYWEKYSIDLEYGGFFGSVSNNNIPDKKTNKSLILNSRILWSFSKAYNFYKNEKYLVIARRAYKYIMDHFFDKKNGGYFWEVNYLGEPINKRKQIYGQSFVIYALSEFYISEQNPNILKDALELFNIVDNIALDKTFNGYFEAFSEDWEIIDDVRLSDVDLNEVKSNNTHLHIMESYTNLYKVSKNSKVKSSLLNVTKVMLNKVLDSSTYNFTLFFDEKWNKKSSTISYGHEIEGVWLIYESLVALDDDKLLNNTIPVLLKISENCFQEGLDGLFGQHGMYNEGTDGEIDKRKIWWVQAEACVGFILAYKLSGDNKYLRTAQNIWLFIEEYIVDKENGEWFYFAKNESNVKEENKILDWKSLYHNSRACFELLERL